MRKLILVFLFLVLSSPFAWAVNYCNDADIVAAYPLDDSTDPPQDCSSNAYHMSKGGTPTFDSGNSPFTTGGSWSFDSGSSEYFEYPLCCAINVDLVGSAYPFTIAGWVKTTATSGHPFFLGKKNSGSYYASVEIDPTNQEFWGNMRYSGSTPTSGGTTGMNTGDWVHVFYVGTSATDRKIYINCVEDGTSTTSVTAFTANDQALAVGGLRDSTPGSYVTMNATEFIVFDAAKSVTVCEDLRDSGIEGTKTLATGSTFKPLTIVY